MAQLIQAPTSSDFMPRNIAQIAKVDNIPQGLITYSGLRIVNAILDSFTGGMVHQNTTVQFDIPNVGNVEIGDLWDVADYFAMNGWKLNVDLAVLIAMAIMKGAKNALQIITTVQGIAFSHTLTGGGGSTGGRAITKDSRGLAGF